MHSSTNDASGCSLRKMVAPTDSISSTLELFADRIAEREERDMRVRRGPVIDLLVSRAASQLLVMLRAGDR